LLAYREVLARHQIDLDPALVVPGAFMPSDGFDGVEALLKQGIEFDAIAAANDFMAMGAVAALRKHGRDVPATSGLPALTTCRCLASATQL